MLTQERHSEIVKIVNERKSVSVVELAHLLDSSESTIRRDLNLLHEQGQINKVHGGATSILNNYIVAEETVDEKAQRCIEEKSRIGLYAAGLIQPGELVFIDAGTTTYCMVSNLANPDTVYVTNGISHAKLLGQKCCRGPCEAAPKPSSAGKPTTICSGSTSPKGFSGPTASACKTG